MEQKAIIKLKKTYKLLSNDDKKKLKKVLAKWGSNLQKYREQDDNIKYNLYLGKIHYNLDKMGSVLEMRGGMEKGKSVGTVNMKKYYIDYNDQLGGTTLFDTFELENYTRVYRQDELFETPETYYIHIPSNIKQYLNDYIAFFQGTPNIKIYIIRKNERRNERRNETPDENILNFSSIKGNFETIFSDSMHNTSDYIQYDFSTDNDSLSPRIFTTYSIPDSLNYKYIILMINTTSSKEQEKQQRQEEIKQQQQKQELYITEQVKQLAKDKVKHVSVLIKDNSEDIPATLISDSVGNNQYGTVIEIESNKSKIIPPYTNILDIKKRKHLTSDEKDKELAAKIKEQAKDLFKKKKKKKNKCTKKKRK